MSVVAVGNDVIDLGDPETAPDACHARFDARVFAPEELDALRASTAPRRLRWILWAAKEAAYKVARKRDGATVFSPHRFAVQLHGDGGATVRHEGLRVAVALEVGARHVHAVARDPSAPTRASRIVTRVAALAAGSPACPGDAVRRLAIVTLAPLVGRSPDALAVARDGRLPRLCDGHGTLRADLSLSHHGRFVAFACALPARRDGDGEDA